MSDTSTRLREIAALDNSLRDVLLQAAHELDERKEEYLTPPKMEDHAYDPFTTRDGSVACRQWHGAPSNHPEPSERYDFNSRNVTGTYPIDWENDMVPIQLWKEQYDEIVRLRGELDKFGPGYWEIQRERNRLLDDVKDLEDCRELLRRLGQLCGCDHVDGADERLVQVRHIEEAFDKLHSTIAEREEEVAIQYRQRNAANAELKTSHDKYMNLCHDQQRYVEKAREDLARVTKQRDHYLNQGRRFRVTRSQGHLPTNYAATISAEHGWCYSFHDHFELHWDDGTHEMWRAELSVDGTRKDEAAQRAAGGGDGV